MLKILSVGLLLFATSHGKMFQFEEFDNEKYLKQADVYFARQLAEANEPENYRLNDDTYPLRYAIAIYPNSTDTNAFFGDMFVEFKATKPVSSVVFNLEDIVIMESEIREVNGPNIVDHCDTETWKEYRKAECKLMDGMVLDETKTYVMHLVYEGKLGTDNRGLYPSYYTDRQGQKKHILTTHFGQQARRLFPGWDEPKFKAQFEFFIYRDPLVFTTQTISNANLDRVHNQFPWQVDVFKATTDISTYILAIVISDFHVRTDNNPRGQHKFAVFARENALDQTRFAQDIGPKLITAFNEWTGLNYYEFKEVEKMDMAAIPDFSAGAMENWGLMIHREVNILYDQRFATSLQLQRIALVISHEVSHMWFGDLVTCDWWDATWLNEGFARYFQFIALEQVSNLQLIKLITGEANGYVISRIDLLD